MMNWGTEPEALFIGYPLIDIIVPLRPFEANENLKSRRCKLVLAIDSRCRVADPYRLHYDICCVEKTPVI
jgi:hypothetical protein